MKRGSLARYIVVRVLLSIPMVLILLTLVFVLLHAAPGDPVTATVGSRLPPDEIQARKEALGLNDPIYVQYVRFIGNALQGDFGDPVTDRRTVLQIVAETAPATLELVVAGMIVTAVFFPGRLTLTDKLNALFTRQMAPGHFNHDLIISGLRLFRMHDAI